jgi:hypothetical protein
MQVCFTNPEAVLLVYIAGSCKSTIKSMPFKIMFNFLGYWPETMWFSPVEQKLLGTFAPKFIQSALSWENIPRLK